MEPRRQLLSASSLALLGALLSALFLASPGLAHADRNRPVYAGFGGGVFLDLGCNCDVHGRISGEFGWHFGREDTGFVMAVELHTTLGRDFFGLLAGLRLGGDIEVHGNWTWAILLRPSGLIGIAARDYGFDGYGVFGHLVVQPAFDVRFAFAERSVVFWLRPVAFDIQLEWTGRGRDWFYSGAYQALAGFDFQF